MFNCKCLKEFSTEDELGNKVIIKEDELCFYAIVYGKYKVSVGVGFAYFSKDEFFEHFKQVA